MRRITLGYALWGMLAVFSLPVQAVPDAGGVSEYITKNAYVLDGSKIKHELNLQAATAEELNAVLIRFDRYASYTPAGSFQHLKNQSQVKPASIGMDLVRDADGQVVCIPFGNSPAALSGVEYRDVLLGVNKVSITTQSLEEIADLIRGKKQTYVELILRKSDGSEAKIVVERTEGSYPDVEKTGLGHETLKIYRFSRGVSEQLSKLAAQLQSSPDQRIFIDLRGNTGGILEEGAKCAALFLQKGQPLYRFRTKAGLSEVNTTQDGPFKERRLIILTDELTASAAELMIEALKTRPEVGTYGRKTAGKAYIQDVFNLQDGAVIKFTTGELLDLKEGESWQDRGMEPDIKR